MKKYLAALVAAASLTAVVAGCSQDSTGHGGMDMGGASAPGDATALPDGVAEADVTFAQSMIPHHEQAVEMSRRVLAEGADPRVRDLATRIEAAQAPEIEMMSGWLDEWGRPTTGDDSHRSMDGMMNDDEMSRFGAATGEDLDRMFLEMMIRHHEGAVAMAEEQIDDGTDADAIALATAIAAAQRAEIEEMDALLASLTTG